MRVEKWQALGNDYLVVEAAALPWELTGPRVRALCAPHTGLGADGVLLLSPAEARGFVARLRIFNPDGSEAELSGNGVREAVLYLHRRGWTPARTFSVETAAGEVRPTITSPTSAEVDMGRARLRSGDHVGGDADGRGELEAGGRTWRYRHVHVGNPQCTIRVEDEDELAALDLASLGPPIEHDRDRFPNRTNVSWWAPLGPDRIRARIFERGVGETSASGTGACGAAVDHVLRGGDSPVTVVLDGGELRVTVEEDLHLDLAGEAEPVYAAELSAELLARLAAAG